MFLLLSRSSPSQSVWLRKQQFESGLHRFIWIVKYLFQAFMALTTKGSGQKCLSLDLHTVLEIKDKDTLSFQKPHILSALSSLLDRVVVRNQMQMMVTSVCISSPKLTLFHGLRAPAISIENYLDRIFRYADCSPSCFVVAYAYIDRFLEKQPDMLITHFNVHRLLITSIMVAAKVLDDT
ncbi:hypothetical protein O6H91_16G009800 [Diphasiastrum complanatum]|nr:hypothetical protein O6H91_16G009800 [Diphasiastrum complanatum]